MSFARKFFASSNLFLIAFLTLVVAPKAGAGAIHYEVDGDVLKSQDMLGPGPYLDPSIKFQGVTSGSLSSPGSFALGTLSITPLDYGKLQDYDRPLDISVYFSGAEGGPRERVDLFGSVDARLGADGRSMVEVTINQIDPHIGLDRSGSSEDTTFLGDLFKLEDLKIDIPAAFETRADGTASVVLTAEIRAVPEPTVMAIFITAGCLGILRRVKGTGRMRL